LGHFLSYTGVINPWLPVGLIEPVGTVATAAEILFSLCLLLGYRTERAAQWSGWLLLLFGLAMTFSTGVKGPLDYSVFSASAAAFALAQMKSKWLEIDAILPRK
jgi:hypothetical protein